MKENQINTQNENTAICSGGKSYTYSYPEGLGNDYSQYCFSRLPCGICTRTNQMCPLVSNSQPSSPFIYCNSFSNSVSSNNKDDIKATCSMTITEKDVLEQVQYDVIQNLGKEIFQKVLEIFDLNLTKEEIKQNIENLAEVYIGERL